MESGMVSVYRWTAGSQVYFLTHLHTDHLCELTSKWSRGASTFLSYALLKLVNGTRFSTISFWFFHYCLFHGHQCSSVCCRKILYNTSLGVAVDTLGKENLLLYISRVLKTKILVWPERLQIMLLLGFHDIVTTKTSVTRIHAVPRYSFNIETLEGLNTMCPTTGIMPSGLPWVPKAFRGKEKLSSESPPLLLHDRWPTDITTSSTSSKPNGGSLSAGRYDHYINTVPYSDHSCFPELQKFVEFVKPINIKVIVSSSASNVDLLYHFGSICRIQQASELLCQRLRSKRYEKVGVIDKKSSFGCTSTMQLGRKKRKRQISSAGIHVSRVRLLRRESQGVKIVDTDPD